MKKVTRNIAIVLTVLWGILLAKEIYAYATFEPPPHEGGLAAYGGQLMRGLFMVIEAGGTFCSGMLAIVMHKFRDSWYHGLSRLEQSSVDSAVVCNLLLYFSIVFLFWTNSILTVLVPLTWVISTIVCFCLLVGVFCQVPPQEISQ